MDSNAMEGGTAVRRRRRQPETGDAATDNLGLMVGQNLKRLRTRHGLSMESLARTSGVSRAMLSQIELGRSIPTINIVWKIARAFNVPFSALISIPNAPNVQVLPLAQTKLLTSVSGAFSTRALFPFDSERDVEFYELRLKAGTTEFAEPHAPGTHENIVLVQGVMEIEVDGTSHTLTPGDAILFLGDRPHAYRNPGDQETLAYLVMTYVDAHA